jgi:hypothetical protein
MQSITTKYMGATNSRGSRIKATPSGGGKSVSIPYDHGLDTNEKHHAAAKALAKKMGWDKPMLAGSSETVAGAAEMLRKWPWPRTGGEPPTGPALKALRERMERMARERNGT